MGLAPLAQAYLAQAYPAPVPAQAPECPGLGLALAYPGLGLALAFQGLVPGCLVLAQACLASAPGPGPELEPELELAGMEQALARRWRRNRIRRRHKRPAA